MKLVALCLFAVYCCSLVHTASIKSDIQKRKLEEVLSELRAVNQTEQDRNKNLSAPPENLESGCCQVALRCFRSNMSDHFNVSEGKHRKLHKSLQRNLTITAICGSGRESSTCQSCASYPRTDTTGFLNTLETLVQKAMSELE